MSAILIKILLYTMMMMMMEEESGERPRCKLNTFHLNVMVVRFEMICATTDI